MMMEKGTNIFIDGRLVKRTESKMSLYDLKDGIYSEYKGTHYIHHNDGQVFFSQEEEIHPKGTKLYIEGKLISVLGERMTHKELCILMNDTYEAYFIGTHKGEAIFSYIDKEPKEEQEEKADVRFLYEVLDVSGVSRKVTTREKNVEVAIHLYKKTYKIDVDSIVYIERVYLL